MNRIRSDLDGKAADLHGKVGDAIKLGLQEGEQLDVVGQGWEETVDATSALLAELSAKHGLPEETRTRLQEAVAAWREVVHQTRGSGLRGEVTGCLVDVRDDLGQVSHLISDMGVIEERMSAVAREGQTLLNRLLPPNELTPADANS